MIFWIIVVVVLYVWAEGGIFWLTSKYSAKTPLPILGILGGPYIWLGCLFLLSYLMVGLLKGTRF